MPVAWMDTGPRDPDHYITTEAGRPIPHCTCPGCLRYVEPGALVRMLGEYERGAEAIRRALRERS